MRTALLLLAVALAGCTADTRRAIGQYQAVADKGATLGNAAQTEQEPAAKGADKAAKPNLPATLGGDTEHRAYADTPH